MGARRWTYPLVILVVGAFTAIATWAWAKVIGGRLVFAQFPDPIMLGFNFVSFLILAALAWVVFPGDHAITTSSRRLRARMVAGGFLALFAFSVHVQVGYWLSRSSTTPLIFIFYLPYVAVCLGLGLGLGAIVGLATAALAGRGRGGLASAIDAALLFAYVALNLHLAHYGRFTLPPEIGVKEVPGASRGGPAVSKRLFLQALKPLGAITSLEARRCLSDAEAVLTVTGRGGAAFVTREGVLKSFLRFQHVGGFDLFPVDVEGDGTCEFADNAGGWSPVGLIDSTGKRLWTYGKSMGARADDLIDVGYAPRDMIPFDADADGTLDFLIPLLIVERRETHVVSSVGRRLRTLPCDLQGARAADVDGDGREELIRAEWSSRQANYVVRDATLAVARRYPISASGGLPPVQLMRWPEAQGAWRAVYRDGKRLRLLDLANGTNEEYGAWDSGGHPAAFVRFSASARPYVAWCEANQGTNTLSLFDSQGRLVYKETLAAGGVTLVLPDETTGGEKLLLAECGPEECGRVWEYTLPSAPEAEASLQ